jgi:outer membrane protein TolC
MISRAMAKVWMAVFLAASALPLPAQTEDAVPLSLEQSRRIALANNLDLESAKLDPVIEEQQVELALAPFDPVVRADVTYFGSDGEGTFNETTTTDESTVLSAGATFEQLLKFGGFYQVGYRWSDREEANTSLVGIQVIQSDGTASAGELDLEFRMPLLKGFGREVNLEALTLARGRRDISLENLETDAVLTIQSVEDAYWNVLAAREGLRISRLALERAEDLLDLNEKKVEVGTLAPIEITRAEAGVSSQVETVIVSETALENAEDALLRLMAVPPDDPMWDRSIELTDQPSFVPLEVDLQSAIDTAFANRPEIASARQNLRNAELSERVAKKRRQHQLDAFARVTPDSQSDSDETSLVLSPAPDSEITVSDRTGSDWEVGLAYVWPLHNRGARADYTIAQLNRQKSELALESAEQNVRVEVRSAVREIESAAKRVEAARQNVVLQQKNLEAEQKKFDNGMSTSFEVLQFQNDLADAERNEVVARLDYLKALTELERARGTLLESRSLEIVLEDEIGARMRIERDDEAVN